MNRLLDGYLNHPGIWDVVICVAACIGLHYGADIIAISSSEVSSIQTSLASTAVSLAGFIIAALTIIVTFKANITAKRIDDSANGMELLFNSDNYGRIVSVFQFAILELVACFGVMHGAMFITNMLTPRHNLLLAIIVLIIILLSLARCLFVLFNVLSVESQTKPE
ncbi:hypothetical protein [Hymenobacter terrestris]|uniref:DUF2254 domain-containing protein n=1 Tax=Hymenobacter terrestris TaxID=2748310 RepID=A0ABX2Q0K9_9BACT|nr:hypothetical protein [Hymenobacter terrestris]NVO84485.1 hypothetical protein [Hymenobacter terrestris]